MKKVISVILSVLMLLNTAAVFAAEDTSLPSEWAREAIAHAEELGILKDFDVPWTDAITREEFCVLAYNMLFASNCVVPTDTAENPFDDTDNYKVNYLCSKEIIQGKGERIFAPNDTLTREEAAVILYNMWNKYTPHINYPYAPKISYPDDGDVSDWAKTAVYNVSWHSIMQGTENGFEPKASYTAEQSVVTLMRLYRYITDNAEDTDLTFTDKLNAEMPSDKNYMFSPLSIKMAFAMAANGAEGETQKEILDVMGISDLESFNTDAKAMIKKYSSSDVLKLKISNSIWINTDNTPQKFSPVFESKVKDVFGATSDTVTRDNALSEINGWANEKTEGKIPEIITEDNLNFLAMLINAVYFKANWEDEFNENLTKEDIFTDRNGKENKIDFMKKRSYMDYSDINGVKIVNLPYLTKTEDMDISMYLLMSDNEFNPEKALNSADFSNENIALSVPKFKIEYSIELAETLEKLGIKKAFNSDAEFGKMIDEKGINITEVLHKTYIDVDEKGTEATAATVIIFDKGLTPEPVELKFNKPFTFVIRDNINGEILFVGEYAFCD